MFVKVGKVIRANAGRDKGKFFVVINLDEKFVFIADGYKRKIENPKKKNKKHISLTSDEFSFTSETSNKKLRDFLKKYNYNFYF